MQDPFQFHSHEVLKERKAAEQRLKELARDTSARQRELDMKHQNGQISNNEYEAGMRLLKRDAVKEANVIMFGPDVPPNAREKWLEENGCVKCTAAAVQAIVKLNVKIVELGAGLGKWAKELTNAGVDVVAYDTFQLLPITSRVIDGNSSNKNIILPGDESMLDRHPDRALLLVYPTAQLALTALRRYRGNMIIYVGEPRGGVNGNDEFFDTLQQQWTLISKMSDLERFPKCEESMWILRR